MADPDPILLIVRADDIGSSHAANLGCIQACAEGVGRSVEIMSPCSWFPEAVELLESHPNIDVGVHLTLTSEWDKVKWRPLTHAPSIVDRRGYLFPKIWGKTDSEPCLRNADWKLSEIEAELRAQIELCLANLSHCTHLSYHMGCHHADPKIESLCQELAREYKLDIEPSEQGYERFPALAIEDGDPPNESAPERMARRLNDLQPGKWMHVEHPALDTPEMQATGHNGNYSVAADRQSVTDAWTSPLVREVIQQRAIRLLSYADLKNPPTPRSHT